MTSPTQTNQHKQIIKENLFKHFKSNQQLYSIKQIARNKKATDKTHTRNNTHTKEQSKIRSSNQIHKKKSKQDPHMPKLKTNQQTTKMQNHVKTTITLNSHVTP